MLKANLVLAVFIFLACVFVPPAEPFNIPERLEFDLRWMGFKAGTATLELLDDKETCRIISTARSADWISVFYKVEDRIESVLSIKQQPLVVGVPDNYRVKIREGRHRRDKEVIFNHEKRSAVYIDHREGARRETDIAENAYDPLSAFYHVRTLKLEAGKPVFVDIFDSKKMWNVEVQVLRKERIETVLGTFDTVVIKPLMKSEGIFSRKGEVYIWLTDDKKHIPVRLKTKVAVGSIIATLTGGSY